MPWPECGSDTSSTAPPSPSMTFRRSEEHTSELQSPVPLSLHDALPIFGAEARGPRLLVHRQQIAVALAQPVANAVEAGQVRARLRRREHVVGRDAVARVRERHLLDRATESLDDLQEIGRAHV